MFFNTDPGREDLEGETENGHKEKDGSVARGGGLKKEEEGQEKAREAHSTMRRRRRRRRSDNEHCEDEFEVGADELVFQKTIDFQY